MRSFDDMIIKMFMTAIEREIERIVIDREKLKPETIKLVAEMEDNNRQRLIDQSLENGDKNLFMKLTTMG